MKVIFAFTRIYDLSHSISPRVLVLAYRNFKQVDFSFSELPSPLPPQRLFPITVSVLSLSQAIRGTDLHLLKKAQQRILGYYGYEQGLLPRDMPATERHTSPRILPISAPSNEITIFTQVHKRLYCITNYEEK
jgi:hypothetical protein